MISKGAMSLCLLLLTANVGFGEVIYQFSGEPTGGSDEAFQYTSPDYITSFKAIPLVDLDYCVGCTTEEDPIIFQPHIGKPGQDSLTFITSNGDIISAYVYSFPLGSFETNGTYTSVSNPGTIKVESTPEPRLAFAAVLGFGLLLVWHRRKQRPVPLPTA